MLFFKVQLREPLEFSGCIVCFFIIKCFKEYKCAHWFPKKLKNFPYYNMEFCRQDIESYDVGTRRRVAYDLLQALFKSFQAPSL